MKFTFNCVDVDNTETSKSFEAETLDSITDHFKDFLRGCGFFVSDDEFSIIVERD